MTRPEEDRARQIERRAFELFQRDFPPDKPANGPIPPSLGDHYRRLARVEIELDTAEAPPEREDRLAPLSGFM